MFLFALFFLFFYIIITRAIICFVFFPKSLVKGQKLSKFTFLMSKLKKTIGF